MCRRVKIHSIKDKLARKRFIWAAAMIITNQNNRLGQAKVISNLAAIRDPILLLFLVT